MTLNYEAFLRRGSLLVSPDPWDPATAEEIQFKYKCHDEEHPFGLIVTGEDQGVIRVTLADAHDEIVGYSNFSTTAMYWLSYSILGLANPIDTLDRGDDPHLPFSPEFISMAVAEKMARDRATESNRAFVATLSSGDKFLVVAPTYIRAMILLCLFCDIDVDGIDHPDEAVYGIEMERAPLATSFTINHDQGRPERHTAGELAQGPVQVLKLSTETL